ncbi:MAG: hypothetical protein CSA58_06450 [Micrococcales bacterium]|nr:MAG: hypothetical protein CSA58_06450 [Micrococcales bacterium]
MPGWKGVLGTIFALGLILAGAFAVAYQTIGIPDPNEVMAAQKSTIYYNDGRAKIGSFAVANRTSIPLSQMPQHTQQALIASEDQSFYENRGVSATGIVRAFWNNARGNSQQGGSTITQQYVKNYYLDDSRTYTRKAKEALIAMKIDRQLSKDEIMQNYLNTVFFGRGAYGLEAAAQTYWGVEAKDLNVSQSAMLIGILPSPIRWDPANDPQRATERWNSVLDQMVAEGYLDRAERATLEFPKAPVRENTNDLAGPNGYLMQAVRDELLAAGLDEKLIDGGGFRIISTFDANMQKAAVDSMNNTDAFPSYNRPEGLHAALTAIDPTTGAVRAMYGGPDYLKRQRNAATQDVAQAGSTFKPFTLAAALEDGVSLRSTFSGANNRTFKGYTDGGRLKPVRNYGDSTYGYLDLLRATAKSVNTVYVALNEDVGPEKSMQAAISAGIPEDAAGLNDYLGNVLGTASPHNIDMAAAYSTFAARGERHEPHFVDKVLAPDGKGGERVLYTGNTAGTRVFSTDSMDDLNYALRQVVNGGSGSYARGLGRQAAGKTGTSNSSQSAWFVGYTPQLVAAVSMYNTDEGDNPAPIPGFGGVYSVTGGSFPTRIWTAFMRGALDGAEYEQFEPPVYGGTFHGTRPPPKPTSSSSSPPTSASTATESPTDASSDGDDSEGEGDDEDRWGEDRGGEDRGGGDRGGGDRGGEDRGGEDRGGEDRGGEDRGGEDRGGGDRGGGDRGGGDRGGEDRGGGDG